jgi:hypothetical protein
VRQRTAAAVLVVALGLPVLPLTAAGAEDAPGSGFQSTSLSALAKGQEFLFRNEVPAQLSIPYAESVLRFGDGSSTATVAWPGAIGSHLGTTIVVAGGAPEQFEALDDPAVAYARSGSGDADVTNTSVPGATMHATATKQKATALAAAEGTEALATTAGSTSTQSAVQLIGPTSATGSAQSTVRDVTVGGLVHIASVTSTATGTTDGAHADAKGSTTVSGVTVNGIGVTVDEHGVSVAGTSVLPADAADAVTDALAQAQITLTLTKPVKRVTGGRVEYAAGSLVATTPLGTLTLGGAQLVLSATLSDDGPVAEPPVPVPGAVLPTGAGVPPLGQPSGVPAGGSVLPSQRPDRPPAVADSPLALVPLSVRSGYGWAWVASGLLLTFLTASGLLALSSRWLAPDLSGCPLEGRLP